MRTEFITSRKTLISVHSRRNDAKRLLTFPNSPNNNSRKDLVSRFLLGSVMKCSLRRTQALYLVLDLRLREQEHGRLSQMPRILVHEPVNMTELSFR